MLGYVKPDKGELKVREYEIYTGYYCGVCKSIGKRYGQLPRMALSYDAAFLAVLLASIDDTPDSPLQEHCVGHHIKKKTIVRNTAIDYSADVMLILAWYKLLDDAKDEGKLYAKATMVLLKGIYKKLSGKYPDLCEGIEKHLGDLSSLEAAKCDSLDMAAEAFSQIMEVIFREGVNQIHGSAIGETGNETGEALGRIGYHMGKWIYLMDAVDDIEENIKSGAYNPLLYRFSYSGEDESIQAFKKRIDDKLRFNLFHCLAVLSNSVDSLDIKKNQGIIDNIIYFGLHRKTEEILQGELDESI
ncbi:MAG: hypothetical protein GX663_07885 [Clostridiales bacterium]|nr:hypothetical protein [Clostridiales bacterium]